MSRCIRNQWWCSSAGTSWTKRISSANPTPSSSSTGAMRMAREYPPPPHVTPFLCLHLSFLSFPFHVQLSLALHPEEIGFIDLPQIKSRAPHLSMCVNYMWKWCAHVVCTNVCVWKEEVPNMCLLTLCVCARMCACSIQLHPFIRPAVYDKSDKTLCSEGGRYQVHLPAKGLMKLSLCSLCLCIFVCVRVHSYP